GHLACTACNGRRRAPHRTRRQQTRCRCPYLLVSLSPCLLVSLSVSQARWTSRALQQVQRRIVVGRRHIFAIRRKSKIAGGNRRPAAKFLAGSGFPEFDLLVLHARRDETAAVGTYRK